ncbi:MAG: NAD(P)H-dependent oxidoreductase [Planctomycetota bacterium]|nr:NAD(P)H-dependent oxidoreductase [Planctomycetota bacterium]
MNYLCLSTSLDPGSRSRVMTRTAFEHLAQVNGAETTWLDLADMDLPVCDGHAAWDNEHAKKLKLAVEKADGLLIGYGIYNYGPSAIAKTVLELSGKSFSDKVVGFICAAGGPSSYMSAMSLANCLMLDFRSVIVPRFVYATGDAFEDEKLTDEDTIARLGQLADDLTRMTTALRGTSVSTS